MDTHTHLRIPCGDTEDGRVCVERMGHVALGLSHMDAAGIEWLDASIGRTYLSDPLPEMALAS